MLAQQKALRQRYREVLQGALGDFLLPEGYGGHEHDWMHADADYCVCRLCGEEHVCALGGRCPVEVCDNHHRVCTLTGFVLCTTELCLEWGGTDRMCFYPPKAAPGRPVFAGGAELLEHVHGIVAEVLHSEKTVRCARSELQRKHSKEAITITRLLRECARDPQCRRPNMLHVLAQMHWACRKVRAVCVGSAPLLRRVVRLCAESITRLLQNSGWQRVQKHLCQPSRGRELICSMLYLMRMGITHQQRCLLPRVPELELLLPQQVFLPTVFGIRSKSITEGENIIKLDIRRLPLQ